MDYPYELLRVPGRQAFEKLLELRKGNNGVPVILGDLDDFEYVLENMQHQQSVTPTQRIEAARQIDPVQWLNDIEQKNEAFQQEVFKAQRGYTGILLEGQVYPNDEVIGHFDLRTWRRVEEVLITILPATEAWMAPCFLHIGNWNAMPEAEVHAALFKYWAEKYEATVVSMANDVIEFTVAKPPRTREAALALAREHYLYCSDHVDQGVGSIGALARTLLNASVWYFWWD